ncbi:hypothetical protein Hypma_001171 [Hypsizygus marmoreus]|uniref:Uncharacterized protein n=1 Tax=Hypsizygus marmoreus TaxID=39966 RepID=A0A369JFS5_HYPMA|nr:hypothetical protein Hypma_001171 [Hypsizygus marmoreus]
MTDGGRNELCGLEELHWLLAAVSDGSEMEMAREGCEQVSDPAADEGLRSGTEDLGETRRQRGSDLKREEKRRTAKLGSPVGETGWAERGWRERMQRREEKERRDEKQREDMEAHPTEL